MEKLLRDFRTIGLWGMGGIGKTTTAKYFFKKYSSQYTAHCFLRDIRENSSKLECLREKLLKELFKDDNIDMESDFVKRKLVSMMVFIVLDDVDASEQIDYLMEGIGPNSKIIVTTRDRDVLNGRVDRIHAVQGLDDDESLQLFNLSAFKIELPQMEFEELSKQVVNYAQGLPLALKLLGSFLRGKDKEKWTRILTKLKKDPHEPIDNVLKLSYDGLKCEQKKIFLDISFFFKGEAKDDVEKFFNACGFDAVDELEVLENKALITISNMGEVEMHDLIQEMGWKRVREECKGDPRRRSRLRNQMEIYDMLKNNTGSDLIEGITLDISKNLHLNADSFRKMINLSILKFYHPYRWGGGLPCVYIPSHFELISHKLSYFQWDACPLQSLPSTFCPPMLLELRMRNSRVEKLWDGAQEFVNLRTINISGSKNLRRLDLSILGLPKLVCLDLSYCSNLESLLSAAPLKSLEKLDVKGCSSLKEFSLSSEEIMGLDLTETAIETFPSSIGRCTKLKYLYLPNSLKNLPNELSNLRSLQELELENCRELDTRNLHIILGGLQSLEGLDLSGCCNLSHFPNTLGALSSLKLLALDGSSVESLPASIINLSQLEILSLCDCQRLQHLPESKTPLKSLKHLYVEGCSSLKEFSLSSEEIVELDLRGTAIETLSSSIGRCTKLKYLYLPNLLKNLPNELSNLRSLRRLVLGNCRELDTRNLPIILGGLQSLEELDLSGCCNISHFPHTLGALSSLKILTLDGSSVESLPASITYLSRLRTLSTQNCSRLQHLPELPSTIQLLKANNCISLETVSTSMEPSVISCQMYFLNCVKLDHDSLLAYLDCIIKQREACEFLLFSPLYFEAYFPGNKIPSCFLCRETQRSIIIEIPCSHLRGFTFCVIISPGMMLLDLEGFIISCECYSVNGELVKFRPIHKPDLNEVYLDPGVVGMTSDHVYIWYENCNFMGRLDRIEEKANNQWINFSQKIFIEFSLYVTKGAKTMEMNHMIKECGVQPTLQKMERSLDLNMDIKTEGCWDIDDYCRKKLKTFNMELELGTKFYSYQDIDEFESSIIKTGVDGTEFDHVCLNELHMLDQRKELNEFIFRPLSADCRKQKSMEDLTELTTTCLMHNRINELEETIREAGACPIDVTKFQNSRVQVKSDMDLELALGVKSRKEMVNELDKVVQDCRVLLEDGSEPVHSLNEIESRLGHKSKRRKIDLEAEEQQLPLTENFMQPLSLRLELATNSHTCLYNEENEIGDFHHDNKIDNGQLFTNNVRKDNFLGENLIRSRESD